MPIDVKEQLFFNIFISTLKKKQGKEETELTSKRLKIS